MPVILLRHETALLTSTGAHVGTAAHLSGVMTTVGQRTDVEQNDIVNRKHMSLIEGHYKHCSALLN